MASMRAGVSRRHVSTSPLTKRSYGLVTTRYSFPPCSATTGERDKMFSRMRREFGALIRLALPVVLAELGWMAMGIVDTLMVGPLGPAAIAAVGIGSGVFTAIAIFGMGLMLG